MKKMVLVALVMVATLFTSNAKSLSSIDLGSEGECYLFYNDEELYMVLPYAGIYAQIDRGLLSYADSGFQLFSYDGKSRLFITGSINQEFKDFQSDGDNNFDRSHGIPSEGSSSPSKAWLSIHLLQGCR